ncbi:MAG: ATP-dependent zinc protease family protein [Endozoicomonas sp.]
MIRIPAIPAVLLAVTSLTGCQVLTTPATPPKGLKPTELQLERAVLVGPMDQDKKTEQEEQSRVTLRQTVIQTPTFINGKLLVGLAETGYLPDFDLELEAKIDTGATRTSIDARNLQRFERDGRKWVQFELHRTNRDAVPMELPIKDSILIKRPDSEPQERLVVGLTVRIGNITQQLDVSLNDRTRYTYPLLIGRDFLQDMAVADVSKKGIAVERPLETITRQVTPEEYKTAKPVVEKQVDVNGLELLGALESVRLDNSEKSFKARIDTGALTSSLDARDLETFDKGGKQWVRFKLASDSEAAIIELPITRMVEIKRHGELESEERPVVTMSVKLGNIFKPTEFSLRDRSEYDYPVLIAERFLKEAALVDVSQEYIADKALNTLSTPRGHQ